jgi:hypothetical protein
MKYKCFLITYMCVELPTELGNSGPHMRLRDPLLSSEVRRHSSLARELERCLSYASNTPNSY